MCLPMSVTHSLTDSRLVDLTDVTLAFEDANSKLIDVVSVADVDAKERVKYRLVEIFKVNFSYNIGAEVWSRI